MLRRKLTFRKASLLVGMAWFGFFQAVLLVPNTLAQAPAPAPSTKTDQPVDIQATEQEFADDQIIARGNVKVTYKDSIVRGPEARLFRDAEGQAQRAVFTGHPNLVQNGSKINGDTLIFEIVNSKVVAQGHAHSEVISDGSDAKSPSDTKGQMAALPPSGSQPGYVPATTKGGKPQIKWPHAGDDEAQPAAGDGGAETPMVDTAASSSGHTPGSSGSAVKKPGDKPSGAPPEKIITDSDVQEYAKQDGKFDAFGHVHVKNGDISVYADKLALVYGLDGKPETALFTGNVDATQNTNHTLSDRMTYYLQTKRLQASGNVRSKVIQKKPAEDNGKGDKKGALDKKVIGAKPAGGPTGTAGGAQAAVAPTGAQTASKNQDDDTILIVSDAQDYSRDSGRMAADGNVHLYYQDTVGLGPKAICLKNTETGKIEKVIFIGRSQISQTGKKWIADRITFTVANKKVLAEGNSRALIIQSQPKPSAGDPGASLASRPAGPVGAGGSDQRSTVLSTSKVETIR
jgi:lipopolysaccharide export system protein LptA